MGFLKSKQRSTNMEQKFVNDNLKPVATNLLAQGQGGLSSYFGTLTGSDGGAGLRQFEDASGYQDIFDESQRAVTGSNAARGLLASGSTVRGLADRGAQLKKQSLGDFLTRLLQGSQAGLQGGMNAANTVAEVGSQNERVGGWKQILGDVGQIAGAVGKVAGAFSDPMLKDDAELLHREDDGLGIYAYRYKWDDPNAPLRVGVMADEVAKLRPHALGEEVDGFMTVNYEKL